MCIASVKLFLHTQIRAHANEYADEQVCACSARDGMFSIRSYHLKLKRKTILKKYIYLNMLQYTIYNIKMKLCCILFDGMFHQKRRR